MGDNTDQIHANSWLFKGLRIHAFAMQYRLLCTLQDRVCFEIFCVAYAAVMHSIC